MTSLLKLERDRLTAEARSISLLLEGLDEEDVMSRFGLEDRLQEVEEELAALNAHADRNASLALFFGGAPVIGQRGIESEFASTAVGKFQDLVSKIMAEELVGLGQRGPVPARAASTMHITNIVRGSFGFLLEEMNDQGELIETALEHAVEQAGRLLIAYSGEDEEQFELAVGDTDGRVVNTVRDIFQLLHNSDATLRVLTQTIDHSFQKLAVDVALERALTTDVREEVVGLEGLVAGLLPDGHMFEFETPEGIIRGRVSREVEAAEIARWNRDWLNRQVHARFLRTAVVKDGAVARHVYKLLGIGGAIEPHKID